MKKAVITFGRLNPPTVGHQKLVDKVKAEAKKNNASPFVYMSHSYDPKKNPLKYNEKVNFAKKAFGPVIVRSDAKNVIEVLKELEKKGFSDVTIVVGSDRVPEFSALTSKYNGREYTFENLKVVSAGERDPDAEGVEGMSASKMRAAVSAGDLNLFKKGCPTSLNDKEKEAMFNKVKEGMGINEAKKNDEDEDDSDVFEVSDMELDAFINAVDLDSLDDIDEDLNMMFEEYMDLVERKPLTVMQRMAIGRRMKRLAPKLKRRREMLKKRMATPEKIDARSRKAAIKILRKRFAGKMGAQYATLSPSQKIAIDKKIQSKLPMVGKIAKRLVPKIRKAETERLKKARSGNQNEEVIIEKKEDPCWDGYTQYGTKKKNGKTVPNCIPTKEEAILEGEEEGVNMKLASILRQAFTNATERQLVIRALKGGEKSLSNPKLRTFMLRLLDKLLDAVQDDPSMFNKIKDKLRRMSQEDSVSEATAAERVRERIAREKEADKLKHDRMMDQARRTDVQTKNRQESFDSKFEAFMEEGGAGEWGTDKLTKKYKKDTPMEESEPTLNKPQRTPGGPKKFSVYVKNEKGNTVKVNFGDPNMEIKRDDPERRSSFRARHNCDDPGPKTKARYWSCRQWRAGSKVEG